MPRIKIYGDQPVPREVRETIYIGPLAGVTLVGETPNERDWTRIVRKAIAQTAVAAVAAAGDEDAAEALSENRVVLLQQMRRIEDLLDEDGKPVEMTRAVLEELIDRFPLAFTNFAYKLKLGTADAEATARGSLVEPPSEVREGNVG